MVYAQRSAATSHAVRMKKKGGLYLKGLRTAKGLTQRALADKLGLDYYTFISQMEVGHARVPTELYAKMAEALGVPRSEFATNMLRFYDPITYAEIFGTHAEDEADDQGPGGNDKGPKGSKKPTPRRKAPAKKVKSLELHA